MSAAVGWVAGRGRALRGAVTVTGDKSISHRALMLAALADGDSRIEGFLEAGDTHASAAILSALGVRIEAPAAGIRVVHGVGIDGLRQPEVALDCGNSGTAMRLLAGMLAGQCFSSILIGDASLSRRPMQRVAEPLRRMGARLETNAGGFPPLKIYPASGRLHGIDYSASVASAQLKSAILLAGLRAAGVTTVRERWPTRSHTERMLRAFGYPIQIGPGRVSLVGGGRLHAAEVAIPADFSAAAFFIVAACLLPGSDLRVLGVGMNPRRIGLLHVLRAMGASIVEENPARVGGEPVADLRVRHARLHGVQVPRHHVADMIDEFPILFIAAACAEGVTRITGAGELRVKESDRIATMAVGLRRLGVRVEETDDGALIHAGRIGGGRVDSNGDHRIAMAFAVAGQCAHAPVEIVDVANVATSFPGFLAQARRIGFELSDVLPSA